MTEDSMKRQLSLEHESITTGIAEYRRKVQTTPVAEHPVGILMMKEAIEPLIQSIAEFRLPSRTSLEKRKVKEVFNHLQLSNEVAAYISLKAILPCCYERTMLGMACEKVANMLIDHHEYEKFKASHKNYLNKIEQDLSLSSFRHKRTAIMHSKRKAGVEDTEINKTDRIMIGQVLVDLVVRSTGLFELEHYTTPRAHDSRWYIRATDKTLEWMNKTYDEMCNITAPFYLPMVIPPKRWSSPTNGGYYSDAVTLRNKIIKTRKKATIEALREAKPQRVYDAINTVQETPWRINKRILNVLNEVWYRGNGELGDLPSAELKELPAKWWSTDEEFEQVKLNEPDRFMQWRWATREAHNENIRQRSKRIGITTRLRIADRFKDELALYFPHTLDFRGRLYPIPTLGGMHPQGDDTGKALLEFSEGKALGSQGFYWLQVHGANTYGYDKAVFDDRVQWVRDHHAQIMDCADNPLDGSRFWTEADSPYCFLAFCFEYQAAWDSGITTYVSHLPVGMDGSCNGLQHFSALLRDEVGGAAVNLVPSEKPADIYSRVAAQVSLQVEKEALEGDELAALWVGKVDRKMAKRNVMTLPYGAKQYGFKDQLMAELQSRPKGYLDTDDYYKPAIYLAGKMFNGIGEVVIAARDAMAWLQKISTVVNQSEQPIVWTTPIGMIARQEYMTTNLLRIETFWGELRTRIRVGVKVDTDKLDKTKQVNGISPNFVHSLDAAHLMMSVLRMKARGIKSFAMIHDSYGCLAGDVVVMNEELREAFIDLYSRDVLENFRTEVLAQIPEKLHPLIPPIPPKGNLDIQAIRNSPYFFA